MHCTEINLCSCIIAKGYKMSKKCPYDDGFCQKKEDYFNRWKDAVEYAAENRLNWTFIVSDESFAGCPLSLREQADCERFIRYTNIMARKFIKQK